MDSNGNGDGRSARPAHDHAGLTLTVRAAETIRLRGDELDLYGEFHDELYRTIRALGLRDAGDGRRRLLVRVAAVPALPAGPGEQLEGLDGHDGEA